MATVIDRLVVELGLDPKQFTKGQKEAAASIVKTREVAQKHGSGIEKSMDGAAEAVDRLARNALKLFAIFTAGRAISAFTADITAADAALGRLAKSVGSTPEVISSLSNAVSRNGGSASAAAGSFERLADSINEIKTTGNSSILPYLYRLQGMGGKQINLNKELSETFADLAENAKSIADQKGVPFATYLLKQAGVDRDTAALLVQGRQAYNKALAESRKIGIVRKEDTEAAQKLQTVMEELRQTSEGFGRTVLTALTPTISDLLTRMREWITANQDWIKTDIVEKVRQFAEWLKSIDWDGVGKGLRDFGAGALKVADTFGGLLKICEALFVFWVGSKAIAIVASILRVAGLLTGGPLGLALKLALAASIATDLAVPNADKPGVITRSDDENAGAAVGPSGGHVDGNINRDRGRVRRWWGRNMPTWLGGGEDGIHTRARRGAAQREGGGRARGNPGVGGWWTPERQHHAIERLKAGGVSDLGARALVARWSGVEAAGGPSSVNPSSGAFGIGQWLGARKRGIAGNTNFDAQLDHAIGELNGPERRARDRLNSAATPAEAATGASMFERAEGYNARTGRDNFTGQTERVMDRLRPRAPAASGNQAGNVSLRTPSDQSRHERASIDDFLDGMQRDPRHAQSEADSRQRYRDQTEGPRQGESFYDFYRRRVQSADGRREGEVQQRTRDGSGDSMFGSAARQTQRLNDEARSIREQRGPDGTTYEDRLEQGIQNRGRAPSEFTPNRELSLDEIRRRFSAPRTGNVTGNISASQWVENLSGIPKAPMGTLGLAGNAQAARLSNMNDNRTSSNSVENNIGAVNIHTQATDASGIARDIKPAMQRHAFASAANYARA